MSNIYQYDPGLIQLINQWNATGVEYPEDHTVINLFKKQVGKNPNSVAVMFREDELTYGELNS